MGGAFELGNSTWRIIAIEPDRVDVANAGGQSAVMPFWHGEASARSPELGEAVGALSSGEAAGGSDRRSGPAPLARNANAGSMPPRAEWRQYIARQKRLAGAVPDDRTILIESFLDQAGELGLAVLSPFGGKFHHALKIALLSRIRDRFGLSPACFHTNDGLLFRLPGMDDPPPGFRATDRPESWRNA